MPSRFTLKPQVFIDQIHQKSPLLSHIPNRQIITAHPPLQMTVVAVSFLITRKLKLLSFSRTQRRCHSLKPLYGCLHIGHNLFNRSDHYHFFRPICKCCHPVSRPVNQKQLPLFRHRCNAAEVNIGLKAAYNIPPPVIRLI